MVLSVADFNVDILSMYDFSVLEFCEKHCIYLSANCNRRCHLAIDVKFHLAIDGEILYTEWS